MKYATGRRRASATCREEPRRWCLFPGLRIKCESKSFLSKKHTQWLTSTNMASFLTCLIFRFVMKCCRDRATFLHTLLHRVKLKTCALILHPFARREPSFGILASRPEARSPPRWRTSAASPSGRRSSLLPRSAAKADCATSLRKIRKDRRISMSLDCFYPLSPRPG